MGIQRRLFKDPSFTRETFSKMNQLRKERKLCDVTLKVNKMEFPVHKVVLAGNFIFELFCSFMELTNI